MGLGEYFAKMKGEETRQFDIGFRGRDIGDVFWAWLGAALAIGITAALSAKFFEPRDSVLLIGSFGASAVLVCGAIRSPLAQPRNLIGGHLISAVIGVASFKLLGDNFVAAGLGVSLAIAAMTVTDTLHPPGGATALIAVVGGSIIHDLGLLFVLTPTGLGALVLLLVALVVNNIPKTRSYPLYWG
jgi:CBS-domain-containing membrane protein